MSAPENPGRPVPERLLLGPGPSNAHPRVLAAMGLPLLGHLDPAFLAIVEDVKARLRRLFGTENEMTLPISATGSAGMEACFVNLLEPGDHAVIGVAGVFGERMCEVAHRAGANVHRVEAEWGTPLSDAAMVEAIEQTGPRVVAFVHAETSTGVRQPVEAIARAAREAGAFVVLDCVTSLGGLPLAIDAWGVDAVYSGTQKCLSCPPGLSPASFSARAVERVAERRTPVQSWYLDVSLLAGYYGQRRVYHHTAPISAIYALAEGLRIVEEEGMAAREKRHREASAHLLEGLSHLGFEPLVDEPWRLPQLNTVRLPERIVDEGEAALRTRLLDRWGIEVGGGLGALAGKIWRIGLMGENARMDRVDRLIHALQDELSEPPARRRD
jgi:alanine-glyoxylate transaminase/serine-glyoxylate transaminase/serine-pyruvate transaminase